MQYALDFGTPSPLVSIHDRLKTHYGTPVPGLRFSPISMLVMAMLGSRTRDTVSARAFQNLREKFRSWGNLAQAPAEQVYDCIREITFAKTYCTFIPQALSAIISRNGELSLDFLRAMTVEDALLYLQQLRGVGPKISACVLNFSELQMRALVIDTHYLRLAARFGIIATHIPQYKGVHAIQRLVPNFWQASDTEAHHVLVKQTAQEFCTAEKPNCSNCPLRDICTFRGRSPGSMLKSAHHILH